MPAFHLPDLRLISQAAAAAFVAARLLHFGLRRRFPLLLSYLLFSAVYYAAGSLVFGNIAAYYWFYSIFEPLALCAAALAVLELFTLVFRDYPGIKATGTWALYGALAFAAVASVAIAKIFRPNAAYAVYFIYYELILERSVIFSLAIVIAVVMFVLSRYPLHLGRNTYVASCFFGALFLAQAADRLIDTVSLHLHSRVADFGEVAISTICLVGWGWMLQAASAPEPVWQPGNRAREAQLLQQLEAMNSILSRSVRR